MHGQSMNEIRDAKKKTRQSVRDAIARMSPQQRREASEAASRTLVGAEIWKNAGCILAYLAFGTEMDTGLLVNTALREGKALFIPRVEGNTMSFHRIYSAAGPFERGVFGIRQPAPENEEWEIGASEGFTLVVVPGMAFDISGGRLGRGGAYYDRFLSRCRADMDSGAGDNGIDGRTIDMMNRKPRMLFMAYGYSCQIIETVPRESHDEKVDGIVSEGGLLMARTISQT